MSLATELYYEPWDPACRDRAFELYQGLLEHAPVYETGSGTDHPGGDGSKGGPLPDFRRELYVPPRSRTTSAHWGLSSTGAPAPSLFGRRPEHAPAQDAGQDRDIPER